jgi:radical SAM protein with 4Fe4S-binding SPASM domain
MDADLITSGIGVSEATVTALAQAGITDVTVSVDGTAPAHDRQRRVRGGYTQALAAIRLLDGAGLRVGVTTQVNALTLGTLEALAPELQEAGTLAWQLQLTLPQGRAADQLGLVLGSERMPELYQLLGKLCRRPGLRPFITDNLGYFTPDDALLRGTPGLPGRCWFGCTAGLRTVGVMSDGSVKGCLALPDRLVEGNLRAEPLERIWLDPGRFAYSRAFDPSSLVGHCSECSHRHVCRGGCTATSLAFHQRTGISHHCFRLQGAPA